MATKKSQRIFIWVIAIVMTVGTLAGFIAMMIAPTNQKIDEEARAKEIAEYQKQAEERLKSFRPLEGYQPEAFDAATVTDLKSEVLVEGTGEALKEDSKLNINYFGWTADGKIFESTNVNGVTTPYKGLALNGVIEGWKEGLVGKKTGSTVKLTIPAAKAYGDTDTGTGQPVGPLMFIIEIK
jgi:FKBP-type peptidyl-prolyl cis-trans isomerase